MLAWHITHALCDRRVIATEPAELRVLARTVIEAGGDALLAFRGSDNHVHSVFAGERAAAGGFARHVASALHHRLRLVVPFEPTDVRPIRTQGHLGNSFEYVLGNAEHHGAAHDRLFEASNLPDLLGLRAIGAATRARVRAMLPRVDRALLLRLLGVDALEAAFAPDHLVAAACAAAAIPTLRSRSPEAVAARIASLHVGAPHLTARELEALLGIPERTARRLRASAVDPALLIAIGLQMDLRRKLGIIVSDAPFLAFG
ncbi:MAG: hypothetical protein Q8P18_14330 [Pseudomonadota bacterium]|nr:hypothetical protein [Pseudomonadota bacterium]